MGEKEHREQDRKGRCHNSREMLRRRLNYNLIRRSLGAWFRKANYVFIRILYFQFAVAVMKQKESESESESETETRISFYGFKWIRFANLFRMNGSTNTDIVSILPWSAFPSTLITRKLFISLCIIYHLLFCVVYCTCRNLCIKCWTQRFINQSPSFPTVPRLYQATPRKM